MIFQIYPITRLSILSIRLAIKYWPVLHKSWPRITITMIPVVIKTFLNLSMAIRQLSQVYGVVSTFKAILALRRFLIGGFSKLPEFMRSNRYLNMEVLSALVSAISLTSDQLGKIGITVGRLMSIFTFWHLPVFIAPIIKINYIPVRLAGLFSLIFIGT